MVFPGHLAAVIEPIGELVHGALFVFIALRVDGAAAIFHVDGVGHANSEVGMGVAAKSDVANERNEGTRHIQDMGLVTRCPTRCRAFPLALRPRLW